MANLSVTINTIPCNHKVQDPAMTPGAHPERRQLGAELPSSPLQYSALITRTGSHYAGT